MEHLVFFRFLDPPAHTNVRDWTTPFSIRRIKVSFEENFMDSTWFANEKYEQNKIMDLQ
jgi:hypothetical protein